jgi:hypothetical protein
MRREKCCDLTVVEVVKWSSIGDVQGSFPDKFRLHAPLLPRLAATLPLSCIICDWAPRRELPLSLASVLACRIKESIPNTRSMIPSLMSLPPFIDSC